MAKTTRAPSRLRQRRIVERPRLRRLLDDAAPRVRMLIAPAGFGKTTLAEQWADSPGRRSAWYRARSSSRDVAVLATGLSDAAATVLPGCDARFRERLSVTGNPSDEAHVLAEMLAEDLSGWPDDAWLVLDDHHNFDGAAASELFLATLVRQAPVNVLLTSRDRPAWVSSRDLLYGSVFELSQSALAMTQDEASDVLVDWDRSRASGLIALADGWPAVIGLAGIAPDAAEPDAAPPAELYAYFAEEVLQALGDDVRDGLSVLAIPPVLDAQIATALLGQERARRVCAEGLAAGILVDRGGRLDVHPLAVKFICTEGSLTPAARGPTDRAIALYTSRRDWEAVGELVERTGSGAVLEDVLPQALDELLKTGRLETIDAWIARLRSSALPIVRLAQAEVDLRRGKRVAAEILAGSVAEDENCAETWRYRGAYLAGRAAHLDSRESEGRHYFSIALELAPGVTEWRDAMRGKIMCAAGLEEPDAEELLGELEGTGVPESPYELVRTASSGLCVSMYLGALSSLVTARRAAQLVDEVPDPMIRCSFRSIYSGALTATLNYEEATRVARAMIEDARRFRVDFAMAYGYASLAAALAGLKRYDEAEVSLDALLTEARRLDDGYTLANEYGIRVRTLLQQGRVDEACDVSVPDTNESLKSIATEARYSRALALLCAARLDEASEILSATDDQSRAIEPVALGESARAVLAVRRRDPQVPRVLKSTMASVARTGALDMLVCTYRACPDLLGSLAAIPSTRSKIFDIATQAGDVDLLEALGAAHTPHPALTKREAEVYDLVCAGLSNRDIADALFLSPSTVKVHVHHIFDKLGIRNRTALIMLAADERKRQATSTSEIESEDSRDALA